ncbi:MAG: hypothetical protein WC247_16515, partial [Porticoccaceae bacterium]
PGITRAPALQTWGFASHATASHQAFWPKTPAKAGSTMSPGLVARRELSGQGQCKVISTANYCQQELVIWFFGN